MIGFGYEFIDEGLFILDFGAADNEKNWAGWMLEYGGEVVDFVF